MTVSIAPQSTEKAPTPPAVAPAPREKRSGIDLDWVAYSIADRVAALHAIKQTLPPLSLDKINVVEDLLAQRAVLQEFQAASMRGEYDTADKEASLAQVAAVVNAMTKLLMDLAKVQNDTYNSERYKQLESLMISWARKLPEETASDLLDDYEKMQVQGETDLAKALQHRPDYAQTPVIVAEAP